MAKKKQKKATFEEMAAEVSRLVDRGEATFNALRKISNKYKLDKKQERILEKEYMKIPFKPKT